MLKLNPRTLRLIDLIESSSLWNCAMLNYDQVKYVPSHAIANLLMYAHVCMSPRACV